MRHTTACRVGSEGEAVEAAELLLQSGHDSHRNFMIQSVHKGSELVDALAFVGVPDELGCSSCAGVLERLATICSGVAFFSSSVSILGGHSIGTIRRASTSRP